MKTMSAAIGTETSVLAPSSRAVSGGSFQGQSSAMRDGSISSVKPKASCISAEMTMMARAQSGSLMAMAQPPAQASAGY